MPADQLSRRLHEATPATRNRAVDGLRAGSLLVVVLGHWLMAVVSYDDGAFTGANLLAVAPATRWLTWVLQIMPVFFLVGGYANAASWDAAQRNATSYGVWMRARSERMLRPVGAFVIAAAAAVLLARELDAPVEAVRLAAGLVTVPLWFIAAYLPVVALTPVAVRLHRRFGMAVPLAMVIGAAVVDVGHRGLDLPAVGWVNFALVWPLASQLGVAWRDGALPRSRRTGVAALGGGLAALVLLTQVLGYPIAMVGGPGAGETSNTPPSLAIVALTVAQLGAVLLGERRLERWLRQPRVWMAVAAVNLHAMTLFAWHLAVLVAVTAVALPLDLFPQPPAVSLTWWWTRVPWLLLLATVLVAVVAVTRRFERGTAHRGRSIGTARAACGVVAASAALSLLALGGLVARSGPPELRLGHLALLAVGAALLGVVPRRPAA